MKLVYILNILFIIDIYLLNKSHREMMKILLITNYSKSNLPYPSMGEVRKLEFNFLKDNSIDIIIINKYKFYRSLENYCIILFFPLGLIFIATIEQFFGGPVPR